ncbi:MAG: hypothetical protein F7C33_03600 [Desulfurococcales archaeon]|nr:hypothetical protein [Desulfurococcales archaeon]
MEEPVEEHDYLQALEKAEEAARKVIEEALGVRSTDYNLIISISYDNKGPAEVSIEVSVSRPRVDKRILAEVVNAAVEAARKTFEKEISGKTGTRATK